MKKWHILVSVLLLNLQALGLSYLVNPEHSKIKFEISYMKITHVEGLFPKYDIYFELDENENLQDVIGKIYVKDINTNDKKRDSHLVKSDFFDAKKFPTIEIKINPNSIGKSIKTANEIFLDLTIKNISKTVKFDFEYLGLKSDPWTKVQGLYFNLTGELNRLDFGITWNKKLESEEGFLIGDKVKLMATVESYHSNEKPAFSRFYKEKQSNEEELASNNIPKNSNEETPKETSITLNENQPLPTTNPENKVEYASFKNIATTLVSGFIVFILLIILGIFGQKKLLDYLETKKFSDTTNFIIASGVTMIILIIISIYIAPLMGHGINPLTKLFN